MSLHRLVCLSSQNPTSAPIDLLDVCRAFPEAHRLSGVGGKLLCLGDQHVLLLEGPKERVVGMLNRLQRSPAGAGLKVEQRGVAAERAYSTVSITELYLDEARRKDPQAAEELGDRLIDLLAGRETEGDAFAEIATLVERFTQTPGRVTELAA